VESSEFFETVRTVHEDARRRKLFFQQAEDDRLAGRHILLNGADCLAFASCSYLGLERHPALIAGVHDFTDRYGTQFSASRGYVSLRAHQELEASLDTLFEGHCLLATSTTLAHQIALPVLATEKDAIVMDHQVHHSVQMAATLARASGTQVVVVRHGEMEKAEEQIALLARSKRVVWFACDGVFSMFGDLAPLDLLRRILAIAPNVWLYIDDAHGMSWAGRHGRGSFLSRMPMHDRLVVATSLNKAFSASGGCVIFPSHELRERVRVCGGPFVFSGPLQPPMLGAALASAAVHRSPEILERQRALRERVDRVNDLARDLDLPLLAVNESPIFFFRCGVTRVAFNVAEILAARGIYVTPSAYPSVPMHTAGIRLSLTTEHSMEDIDRVVHQLAEVIPEVMASESLSRQELDRAFARAIPSESLRSEAYRAREIAAESYLALSYASDPRADIPASPVRSVPISGELQVQVARTIREIDRSLWDALLGARSCSSWDAMAAAEAIFQGHEAPEHNWSFLYVLVRDDRGQVVAATYFTVMLNKDDMLMRTEVSAAIEARRRDDPYLLTSLVVCMGSGFSEGSHLYLDREGPWMAALTRILSVGVDEYEARGAGILMLRDFREDDEELRDFLHDSGFIKVPMLDSHLLEITWKDSDAFMARLSRRARRHLRELQKMLPSYGTRIWTAEDARDEARVAHLYKLYRNVADRKLRLNTFPLPVRAISGVLESPAWELVSLHLAPEAGGPIDGAPVAWYAAHKRGGHYAPLVCGLDYDHVYAHGAYRQLLYQIILRAQELSMTNIHFGMDAAYEKERLGTTPVPSCAYVHTRDDFVGARMREVIADVGLGK